MGKQVLFFCLAIVASVGFGWCTGSSLSDDAVFNILASINNLQEEVEQLKNLETRINQLELNQCDVSTVNELESRVEQIENKNKKLKETVTKKTGKLDERIDFIERGHTSYKSFFDKSIAGIDSMWMQATKPEIVAARECADYFTDGQKQNGVYTIVIGNSPVQVYCDMEDGGWTVFQRRFAGTTSFARTFGEYVQGFGSPSEDYWLGLENIHQLTRNGSWDLKVDLMDQGGWKDYAQFSNFKLGEGTGYILTFDEFTQGGAGDALSYQKGGKFSTPDFDQDPLPWGHCAEFYQNAWWHTNCHESDLNSFRWGARGMMWKRFSGNKPIVSSSMKVRLHSKCDAK